MPSLALSTFSELPVMRPEPDGPIEEPHGSRHSNMDCIPEQRLHSQIAIDIGMLSLTISPRGKLPVMRPDPDGPIEEPHGSRYLNMDCILEQQHRHSQIAIDISCPGVKQQRTTPIQPQTIGKANEGAASHCSVQGLDRENVEDMTRGLRDELVGRLSNQQAQIEDEMVNVVAAVPTPTLCVGVDDRECLQHPTEMAAASFLDTSSLSADDDDDTGNCDVGVNTSRGRMSAETCTTSHGNEDANMAPQGDGVSVPNEFPQLGNLQEMANVVLATAGTDMERMKCLALVSLLHMRCQGKGTVNADLAFQALKVFSGCRNDEEMDELTEIVSALTRVKHTFSELRHTDILLESSGSDQSFYWSSAPGPRRLFPRGVSFPAFVLTTLVSGVVIIVVNFVAVPHLKKLRSMTNNEWWRCALSCATGVFAIAILLFRHLFETLILTRSAETVSVIETLLMWLSLSGGFALPLFFFDRLWTYPAPFSVFIGLLSGSGCFLALFLLVITPKVKRIDLANQMTQMDATIIRRSHKLGWLALFLVCFLVHLPFTFLVTGLISRTEGGARYLGVPGLAAYRALTREVLKFIAGKVEEDFEVVGQYVAWIVCTCATVTLVGASTDLFYGLFVLLVDVAEAADAVNFLRKTISVQRSLGSRPSHLLNLLILERSVCLVVTELSEVFVPGLYLLAWLIVFHSGNSSAFAGIGATAFGHTPPARISQFILNIALWLVVEALSFIIILLFLSRNLNVNMSGICRQILARNGTAMALFTGSLPVGGICFLMLACGFDTTFQLDEW